MFNDTELRYSHNLLLKPFLPTGFDLAPLVMGVVMKDILTVALLPGFAETEVLSFVRMLASCCWSLNFCDMPILTLVTFRILEHDSLAQDRRNSHEPSVQIRSSTLYLISLKTRFLEAKENYGKQESEVFEFEK